MRNYVIAVSSTADLTADYLDSHNIPFIRYGYTIDDELFEDDCSEKGRADVYASMRAGKLLKTSMINEYCYYDFLKELLEGGKDVIFLDMSKKMSASFGNVLKAGEMLGEEYPGRRLYIMDTCCISGGLGMLAKGMIDQMEKGMSFDEVIAWGEERKLHIAHRFTVDDLSYLKAGGRVSNAAALVGSVLGIKPVLYVPDEGTLNVASKVRGRKAALAAILAGIKNDLDVQNTSGLEVDILHADCLSDAEFIRDSLREAYPDLGKIEITYLGVVIGAHCGPGLLTVFYSCDVRKP